MTGILFIIVFDAAIVAGVLLARGRPTIAEWRPPVAFLAVLAVTAGLSVLQFPFPVILDALRRNRDRLLDGQVWRLVTPLFVQDGGAAGTVSNLIVLVMLGALGTMLLGWRRWLLLYFGAGIASEIVAYAWLHQGFAGNSIANFGMAAGLIVLALLSKRALCVAVGAVGLVAGLLLLARGNLHGAAFVIGLVIATPLIARHTGEPDRKPAIAA